MEASAVRQAAVAGLFYPGQPGELARDVAALLAGAVSPAPTFDPPKALIAPHAGYIYSGPIAASAYALLAPRADTIRRVVLLGPCHRVAVRGLAVPDAQSFATPLGDIPLDRAAIDAALQLPQVIRHAAAHAQEHSLEVHLPFLQQTLRNFRLVPFAVGQATPGEVADVLDLLWGGPETLIVVSSDLSHYLAYDAARQLDSRTADSIARLNLLSDHAQACGATPINGLIEVARRRGLRPELLDLRNSGDTAGDRSRVVGYASFAFREPDKDNSQEASDAALGAVLLANARNAIAGDLGADPRQVADHPALRTSGATFVTLTQNGALRGCIGSLQAWRPLAQDVRENARAAAFRDPRFPPLTAEELARTRVEVSLLTPAQPLAFTNEADALRQLRPHIDGVIFECQGRRGTFLPQVWESLPEPRLFFAHLKQKAGFTPDFWSPDVRLYRYEVRKWKEATQN